MKNYRTHRPSNLTREGRRVRDENAAQNKKHMDEINAQDPNSAGYTDVSDNCNDGLNPGIGNKVGQAVQNVKEVHHEVSQQLSSMRSRSRATKKRVRKKAKGMFK